MIRLGAIADDFTGATDLATSLRERGLRVAVVLGPDAVPSSADGIDAVIVALKTRTAPVADAVDISLASIRRLAELEPAQFFVKYCSTFDSTPAGNIGPVLDAVLAEVGETRTIVVPSFPDNGRTVTDGVLRVHGDLLSDSPMRHHPLTPMTESRVSRILAPQTAHEVVEVTLDTVRAGERAVRGALAGTGSEAYVVLDAAENRDLETIQSATSDWRVVSGSAGLAFGMRGEHDPSAQPFDVPAGRRLVVAGSASAQTRAQVAAALDAGAAGFKLDLDRLVSSDVDGSSGVVRTVSEVTAWLAGLGDDDIPLVYSVATLADVASSDERPGAAEAVEAALSAIAAAAVADLGVRQLIVAGGETSGAVATALGCEQLLIGPQIAPGVCWSRSSTASAVPVVLALKSGNFAAVDMFTTAWEVLP